MVRPAELFFSGGKNLVRSIIVKNPTDEVLVFEVYPDTSESIISVTPSSFVLESGAEKQVFVKIRMKKSGILKTNISVSAKPLTGGEFSAGGGVKIPVTVKNNSSAANLTAMVSSLRGNLVVGLPLIAVLSLFAVIFLRSGLKKMKKP